MIKSMISTAIGAIWTAYGRITGLPYRKRFEELREAGVLYQFVRTEKDNDTTSWLYDAACILEVVMKDEAILALLDDYYAHPEKLPWNRRNEKWDEEEKT
jgi:hypothetical protein